MVESARGITVAPDGSIYIGGNTNSFGNGGVEIVLLKFSSGGALDWYKTWGATGDDQTLDIHLRENALYLTGKTNSFHPSGKWEAVLLKVAVDSINATGEVRAPFAGAAVHPNPIHDWAQLTFDNPAHKPHTLVIFDSFGKPMDRVDGIVNGEVTIQKDCKPAGTYFYQLRNEEKVVAEGKMVFN
jgi:hypothetical protein